MENKKPCRRLTAQELATRWGCSTKKLANDRASGKSPPYIKNGNGRNSAVLYRLKDIIAWEKARLFSNTTQAKAFRRLATQPTMEV